MAAQPVTVEVVPKSDLSHVGSEKAVDLSETSTPISEASFENNPFLDPKIAEHYRDLYERCRYECRHVFDPHFEWEPKEERRVITLCDWHVCTWACIMFFALQVDRGNLSQAVSANMLKQLDLSTDEYNYGNTIFYLSFMCAELPSQLVSKKLGPDIWIPTQMVLWSIIAGSQAAMTGKAGFYALRCLLGMLEGGFIPDLVLWLSYFYTGRELSIRLSFFWTAEGLTGVVTSLLAFALLHLDGVHNIAGWRWLFLIEAIITLTVGVAAFFLMPASAVQTKTWFRPKGWFTDRQTSIVVDRVLRDDPSKGDMHNRMGITPKRLWYALTDWDLWPIYLIGILVYIPVGPPSLYLTLSLRHVGFSTFNTNLLTIPSTVIGCLTLIGLTWFSERVRERSIVASLQNWWVLPCIIALRWWQGANVGAWSTFAFITVLLSYPYCHAIVVAWASRNSGSVRTRSVSAAAYNMCVQAGNVISSNIYQANDAPLYHRGNDTLLALNLASILLFILTKLYYMTKNRTRERKWAAMSEDERKDYLDTTKDEGNKRLDFRSAHRSLGVQTIAHMQLEDLSRAGCDVHCVFEDVLEACEKEV